VNPDVEDVYTSLKLKSADTPWSPQMTKFMWAT